MFHTSHVSPKEGWVRGKHDDNSDKGEKTKKNLQHIPMKPSDSYKLTKQFPTSTPVCLDDS